MKIKTTTLFICCGLLFMTLSPPLSAQEMKNKKYVVHEDVVKPSQMMNYEKASKKFAETMREHSGPESQFLAVSLDDMRYLFVSPIENMAALDNNPFASLEESMGKEAVSELFKIWDGTYETHKDYIVNLSNDLSYKSGEIYEEGVNFRHFDYFYIDPDKSAEAKKIAKEWKELYTSKNIPYGYRVYTGGMGTEPMLMVVEWAKSPSEYYANQEKIMEMLGDDASELYGRTLEITKRRESHEGWIRPELSFMPESVMADN